MRAAVGVLVVAVATALATPAHAEDDAPAVLPPQARLGGQAVSIPRIRLGEPFQIAIAVRAPQNQVVDLPAQLDTKPFEVTERREAPPLHEDDGMVRHEWELTVVGWEMGELTFPPVPVKYFVAGEARQVMTEPLTVVIEATIPEGSEPRPAEAAPPVPVTQFDPRFLIAIAAGGGVILIGVSLWLLLGGRRRKAVVPAQVIVDTRTPEQIALDGLRALAASELLDKEDRRLFYFTMTEIVRVYLGRRFGFDALEQTTSELLDALRARADASIVTEVASWTASCDLVKYASLQVSRDKARSELDGAVAIVEHARPPAPPVQPALEAAHG